MSQHDDQINIVRHFSDDPFVRIPRGTARDEALGWRALGMLTFMLSLSASWKFRLSHLSGRREGHGNGRHAVRTALGEMEAGGYLEIKRTRGPDGRINGVEWQIADRPIFARKAPCSDFPTVENPTSENPTLRKKESTREKNEAAARPAQPAPQHAAAPVSTSTPTPRRRRGDQNMLHGVVVWTDQDEAGVVALVNKHGVQEVEEVAARITPPPGALAPYLSAVVAAFQEREARAVRNAAAFTTVTDTAAAPPLLDTEAVRTKMARARAAVLGEVAL